MRILVISNLFPPHHVGGYELRCREVAARMQAAGADVRVLTGRFHRPDHVRFDAPCPVQRRLFTDWGPPWPPEALPARLRMEAINVHALRRLIATHQPDVIDVWGLAYTPLSLPRALFQMPVPVHLTIEDIWLRDAWQTDPLTLTRRVARQVGLTPPPSLDQLFGHGGPPHVPSHVQASFASPSLQRHYASAGIEIQRSEVRTPGIDLAAYHDPDRPPAPPPFVILNVGELTEGRGQMDLVLAASTVAEHHACPWPIELRIVGSGNFSYVRKLQHVAGSRSTERLHVRLLGEMPASDVAGQQRAAHLFVQSSRLPEGLPRVLMESLAAGTPTIATTSGGQRDILEHGRYGALVPPADPRALADAILAVMQNYDAACAVAELGQLHAQAAFDIDVYAADHLDHLRSIARDPAPDIPTGPPAQTPVAGAPLDSAATEFTTQLADTAAGQLETVLALQDRHAAWVFGVTLKRCGRLGPARRAFEWLLERSDDNPTDLRRASFHLGEFELLARNWPSAARLFETCLTVAPDHRKATYDLNCCDARELPAHLAALDEPAVDSAPPVEKSVPSR